MSQRHAPSLAWLLTALLITGCVDEFDPVSKLDQDNQILVLQVTPPEARPGERVILEALVHWPAGTPTLFWLVCVPDVGDDLSTCVTNRLDPGQLPPLCDLEPTARLCIAGLGGAGAYTVPEALFPPEAFPEGDSDQMVYVAMLAATDLDGPVTCQDTLMGGAPTPTCLLALKRFFVSRREHRNLNPVPTALLFDGVSADATVILVLDYGDTPSDALSIELALALDATSVDEAFPPGELPVPAELVVSWFVTCGTVANDRTFIEIVPHGPDSIAVPEKLTTWKPETSGDCTVHAVVRDPLGGAGFISQDVRIPTE